MPIVSGSTIIRGSRGTPVAQDANDKLITVVQGDQDIDVAQAATGELITEMHGSEGVAVKQEATGELVSVIQGSEGVDVKQKATGELVTEIVGSTGNAVAQDGNDKLISVMQGSQGVAVSQDAANRLIAAMVGSTGNPISQDVSDNLIAVMYGSLGNPITQDANDRLVSVMYGSQNTPIAQDAANKLIAVMQGDNGAAISQDASNRLEAVLYGDTGVVAQDAGNNLISVMKGNYGGVLKTWKVDEEGRGEMFINDTTDDWGLKNIIGLAELATRSGAKQGFDNRGREIWSDSFDVPTLQWLTSISGDATVSVSTDCAWKGTSSCKLTVTGNAGDNVNLHKYFYNPLTGRYSAEFAWSSGVITFAHFMLWIRVYDGTWSSRFGLQLSNTANQYAYWNSAAGVTTLQSNPCIYADKHSWHKMKLAVDTDNDKYIRVLIDGTEYDLSTAGVNKVASGLCPRIEVGLQFYGDGVNPGDLYLDNVIFSHLEP